MTTGSYQHYLHDKATLRSSILFFIIMMYIVNCSSNFALYHLLPGIPS